MTTRSYCSKQSCEVYYPPSNNISKKMLQAKAIRLNGRQAITYDTSLSYLYTNTILSGDFDKNKSLLLYIRYKAYNRYFTSSIKCGNNGQKALDLYNMFGSIIQSLTTDEYNHVFDIQQIVDVSFDTIITDVEITFFVVVRETYNYSYFIVKNITPDYYFYPGKTYCFDLSDPSNYNTIFSLSEKKDGVQVKGLLYEGIPGTENAKLFFTIPPNLITGELYVFNENLRYDNGNLNLEETYGRWAYNQTHINIKLTNIPINISDNLLNYEFICINKNSNLAVYEYNGPRYYFNNNINANIIISINKKRYMVSYGTYYIYVPKIYAATLLNNGLEKSISFVGSNITKSTEYLTELKLSTNPVDASYNFYYDTVVLTVYKPFTTPLTFYSKKFGYMSSIGLLYFSDSCNDFAGSSNMDYYVEYDNIATYYGIQTQTSLNIITNGPTDYITFNGNLNNTSIKYGMHLGEYYIFNIPRDKPITFLNNGKENLVKLDAVNGKYIFGLGPDGNKYKFYYGTLIVTVNGNFGAMSIFSTFSGYMGGYSLIKYGTQFNNNEYYPDPRSIPTITELPENTTFNDVNINPIYFGLISSFTTTDIPFSDLYTGNYELYYNEVSFYNNNIIINDNTPYNSNVKYTLKQGIYILKSLNNYLAVLNNEKTNLIKYYGGLTLSINAPDGYTYNYYKDYIAIYVYSNFGTVSLSVIGKSIGIYLLSYDRL